MIEEQKTIVITPEELVGKVTEMKQDGYRLVQIGCAKLETFEMNYTFDKNYQFMNLRVNLPLDKPQLSSVSGVYWSAFLYENEIHDLFGVEISGIAIDFKGTFYKTAVKAPFGVQPNETKEKK